MSRVQQWSRKVAVGVASAVLVVGGAAPVAPAGASAHRAEVAPPALVVTPSAGLVDGQSVTVTAPAGTGGSGGEVDYVQCPSAATSSQNCTPVGSTTGAHSTTVSVAALVLSADDSSNLTATDCRTATCTLRAVVFDGYAVPVAGPAGGPMGSYPPFTTLAETALGFDPAGTLRTPPALTVTPTTGLTDGQALQVSLTSPGLADGINDYALVFLCAAPVTTIAALSHLADTCDFDQIALLDHLSGDTASGTATFHPYVETPTGPLDCRAAGATCTVVAVDPVGQAANVPLTFDPNGAITPALLLRPTSSVDFASMTFDVLGLTPNDPYTVRWCNDAGACLPGTVASGTLDADGQASFDASFDSIPDIGPDDTTCVDGCHLTVTDAHGRSATGGFGFGGGPVPGGPFSSTQNPVTVTPHRDLHDGDRVTVRASGFRPGASLAVVECTGNALHDGDTACDLDTSTVLGGRTLTADADGNLSTNYTIRRHITTGDGPADCATGNVDPDVYAAGVAQDPSRLQTLEGGGYFTCIVAVADLADYHSSGAAPIAFAGAHFKPLPWQAVAHEPRPGPVASPTPRRTPTAPTATPVVARPAFTG